MLGIELAVNAALVLTSLVVVLLPLYFWVDLHVRRDQFLLLICLSFLLPIGYTASQFLAIDMGELLLPIHGILWTMLMTSFLAFFFDKQHFFWGQFAIPLSLIFPVFFLGSLVFEIGAIVALLVLAEVFIYIVIDAKFLGRVMGALGLAAAFLSFLYFFPINFLQGVLPQVFLIGSNLFLLPLFWLFFIHPKRDIELADSPDLKFIWYVLLVFVMVIVLGLYLRLVSPLYVLAGAVMLLFLSTLSHNPSIEARGIFVRVFILAAAAWMAVTLFELGFRGAAFVIDFQFHPFRFGVVALVTLIGAKLLYDRV